MIQRHQLAQIQPFPPLANRCHPLNHRLDRPLPLPDRSLGRVSTIQFARWTFLDDKRRMLFASNHNDLARCLCKLLTLILLNFFHYICSEKAARTYTNLNI